MADMPIPSPRLRGAIRPWLPAAMLAVAATMLPQGQARATAGSQICEVDAADPASAAWVRLQRVVARVAERCQGGDVMALFPFGGEGHVTDVSQLAPLVCRFDAQILLLDQGGGAKRLVCVYAGKAREVR
jgi:hypothetical protein